MNISSSGQVTANSKYQRFRVTASMDAILTDL